MLHQALVHELIDCQVSDVLRNCGESMARSGWQSSTEAQESRFLVGPSDELAEQKAELERFLFESVYRHEQLVKVRTEAQFRLKTSYEGYCQRAERLPARFRRRSAHVGLARSVGEYLAGMTDRFCNQQFARYFQGSQG
jgi:dGTPase